MFAKHRVENPWFRGGEASMVECKDQSGSDCIKNGVVLLASMKLSRNTRGIRSPSCVHVVNCMRHRVEHAFCNAGAIRIRIMCCQRALCRYFSVRAASGG